MKNITTNSHIKVDLLQLSQKGKTFFTGVVPAKDFLNLFTVEPVKYDFQRETTMLQHSDDMKNYFEKSLDKKKKRMDSKGFQRIHSKDRAKEIAKFLDEEEYPFFPNAIISTVTLGEYDTNKCLEKNLKENKDYSILSENDGKFSLYLTKREDSVLVIDGQHRLEGLKQSGTGKENYDLLVTFLLDYDRAVIAKQFYTINYTQKNVNKSLLYHLTGEFSEELDEITFLHEAVKIFNQNEESPLYKRVKMLGVAPKDLNSEEKKMMTLSQAFLIDYFLYTIKDRKANSVVQPVLNYYYRKDQYQVIRFIISYFIAVKELLPEWDSPQESVLSKTIGVGALIKLLNFLLLKIYAEVGLYKNPDKIKEIKATHIAERLKGIEKTDINRYKGGSSAGTVNTLKFDMIKNIPYLEYREEQEQKSYENEFKEKYSKPFLDFL